VSQRDILEGRVPPPRRTHEFVELVSRISRPGDYETADNRHHVPATESLREPGGRLTLGEHQIRFATGQSAIPSEAEPVLADVAKGLKDNPGWTVRIEGFTDNVGSHDSNKQLSQARADAVMNWLADHGVDRNRMSAKGYGESRSIANNSTDDGRAKNRRVEI